MVRTLCISALAILSFAPAALAWSHPTFLLDPCTWNATHVVVVTEGDKIDGVVTVLESWKGDLKKGEKLTVPGLAEFASKENRAIGGNFDHPSENHPSHISCSRIVVFLIREKKNGAAGKSSDTTWKPAATWGGLKPMQMSAAWIEEGKVYAFFGEYKLSPAGMTEREMKTKADQILGMQDELRQAVTQRSTVRIDKAIKTILKGDIRATLNDYTGHNPLVGDAALKEVAGAGKPGEEISRSLLNDYSLYAFHSSIFSAMSQAGLSFTGAQLVQMLDKDTLFWKKQATQLKDGWWNTFALTSAADVMGLVSRFGLTMDTVKSVGSSRHPEAKKSLQRFEKLFLATPQIDKFPMTLSDGEDWHMTFDGAMKAASSGKP